MRLRIITIAVLVLVAIPCSPAFSAPRTPDDPYFDKLWYLQHINVTEAWNTSLGFEGIIVAVIDSGVDMDHPDLAPNIWRNTGEVAGDNIDNDGNGYVDDVYGWDFVSNDNDPQPEVISGNPIGVSHGTISAGIIAAKGDNNEGVVGVTWQTSIMPIRALDSDGVGDPVDVVRAVEYAVNNGAKVINLSFAGPVYNDLLKIALRRAYNAGVFVVAAAGNAQAGGEAINLDRNPLYPICLDMDSSENFIYGVAAVDHTDRRADFSNYGASCVDGSAPGTRIITTLYQDDGSADFSEYYGGYFNGTSVAAPIVSGVAALLKSLNPRLTPKQVTNIFTRSAFDINELNPGFFGKLGRGRIEAARALQIAGESAKQILEPVVSTKFLLPPDSTGRLIVTAPGQGRKADIRIFTEDGLFVRNFDAYPESFRGGASLAVAQFGGNSRQTIVTGAGPGGSPQVRVFNINTQAIGGFYAYDPAFTGGVDVAVGDLDGDGEDEIVTGAGPGGGPHVRIFTSHGDVAGGFFPFDEDLRGGVDVTVGDLDGDGIHEIIAGGGRGPVTAVRILRKDGSVISEFLPFGASYRGGALVRAVDIDGDGIHEIEVNRPDGNGGEVRIFTAEGDELFRFDPSESDLARVAGSAAGDMSRSSLKLVFGGSNGSGPVVTPYSSRLGSPARFYAYESGFMGGVHAETIILE